MREAKCNYPLEFGQDTRIKTLLTKGVRQSLRTEHEQRKNTFVLHLIRKMATFSNVMIPDTTLNRSEEK